MNLLDLIPKDIRVVIGQYINALEYKTHKLRTLLDRHYLRANMFIIYDKEKLYWRFNSYIKIIFPRYVNYSLFALGNPRTMIRQLDAI
jgi:hypothetical protein